MVNGWSGADPTQAVDAASYELGTEYLVNNDITITAIRVWEGATPGAVTGRRGRIWTTGGALLASTALADVLPTGWSSYALGTPLVVHAGSRFVVSYTTGGFYGELVNVFASDVVSADGAVTAESSVHSQAAGNGVFTSSPTAFPDHASGSSTFYGIDIVYTRSTQQPPTIVGFTVTVTGAVATATLNATDPSGLGGATYSFNWGDGGTSTGLSANTATHTYTTSGVYAVLGSVTDAAGLAAYAATPITVFTGTGATEIDLQPVLDTLTSIAQTLGMFQWVGGHEPRNSPPTGLSCAVWLDAIAPVQRVSGLTSTSVRCAMSVRIYKDMLSEPLDSIDTDLSAAAVALMNAYSGDFELDDLAMQVDLLGAYGPPMGGQAGYINIGGTLFRAFTIIIPVIFDNVWQQMP